MFVLVISDQILSTNKAERETWAVSTKCMVQKNDKLWIEENDTKLTYEYWVEKLNKLNDFIRSFIHFDAIQLNLFSELWNKTTFSTYSPRVVNEFWLNIAYKANAPSAHRHNIIPFSKSSKVACWVYAGLASASGEYFIHSFKHTQTYRKDTSIHAYTQNKHTVCVCVFGRLCSVIPQ